MTWLTEYFFIFIFSHFLPNLLSFKQTFIITWQFFATGIIVIQIIKISFKKIYNKLIFIKAFVLFIYGWQ